MTGILERVFAKRRDTEKKVATDKQSLIAGVASGKIDDPDEIDITLGKLGMTAEELQAAVTLATNRKQWQSQADELPAITKALADVQTSVDRANAEFSERLTALRNEHGAEIENLRQQGVLLNSKLSAASNAGSRLCDTMPEDIKRRADAVYQEIRRRQQEIHSLIDRSGTIRGSGFGSMMAPDASKARIQTLKKEIAELTEKAASVESGAWA